MSNILLSSSCSMSLLVIELKIFDCGSELKRTIILIMWTASINILIKFNYNVKEITQF